MRQEKTFYYILSFVSTISIFYMYLFWNCFSIATYKIESIGLSGSGYSRLAGLAANIIPDQIFRSDPRQESFYKWQSMDLFENNTLSSLTIGHSTDQATHPGPLLLLLALEEHHNRGCLYLSLATKWKYSGLNTIIPGPVLSSDGGWWQQRGSLQTSSNHKISRLMRPGHRAGRWGRYCTQFRQSLFCIQ